MTLFKISFHSIGANTFVFEEHDTKEVAQYKYMDLLHQADKVFQYLKIGDILINPRHVNFVLVEEFIPQVAAEPTIAPESTDIPGIENIQT